MVMKPLLRALALGVGPLAAAVSVGVLAQGQEARRFIPPVPLSAKFCTQPPVFKPGYQQGENFVVQQGRGFRFASTAWIQANLCTSGTLRITADGELGGSQPPQLTVFQNDAVVGVYGFKTKGTIEVKVTRSGSLSLGYFNDYYSSDARVATFREFKFTGSNCVNLKSVTVPKESGGQWDAETGAASLVFAVPMTLVPCGQGRLSMLVIGRDGKKVFPELTFEQNGEVIQTLTTSPDWQLVQLDLKAEPLIVTLKNPYFATLADRNLNVQRIEFVPSPP